MFTLADNTLSPLLPDWPQHDQDDELDHEHLAHVGRKALELIVTEYVMERHPRYRVNALRVSPFSIQSVSLIRLNFSNVEGGGKQTPGSTEYCRVGVILSDTAYGSMQR